MRIPDLQNSTDDQLVRAYVDTGDEDALSVLLGRHESKVYGLAYRLTGNRSDALDVAQEVLVKAFTKLPRFERRSSFTTWLYRLTANTAYDLLRAQARRPTISSNDEEPTDTHDRMSDSDERMSIQTALAKIPIEQRTAVVMRDIYQASYEEISEATASPVGTVKSRIARGRATLADLLGELDSDGGRLTESDL